MSEFNINKNCIKQLIGPNSLYLGIWQMCLSKATYDAFRHNFYQFVCFLRIEPMTLLLLVPYSSRAT